MKKIVIIISSVLGILFVLFIIISLLLGINPFVDWEDKVNTDFKIHSEVFENIVDLTENSEFLFLRNDNYDVTNSLYTELFENLDYSFMSINNGCVFFCKSFDGMDAIGLVYIHDSDWVPPPKGKLIEPLDSAGHWYLYKRELFIDYIMIPLIITSNNGTVSSVLV